MAPAIALSRPRSLPPATVDELIANAMVLEVPRGVVDLLQGHDGIHAALIVSGRLRAFGTTEDGRQMTVRYVRAGDLVALSSVHARRSAALGEQALMPSRILRFHPGAIVGLAHSDLAVANLVAEDNAYRVFDYIDASHSCVDGAVVIDLGALRGVTVDARTAQVGGGARWSDLGRATAAHGLATTGGLISHTGVGGLTLGGGIGWLMHKHGLAIDNLVGAEV